MLTCPICGKQNKEIEAQIKTTCPKCRPLMTRIKIGDHYRNSNGVICKVRSVNDIEGTITLRSPLGLPRTFSYNMFRDYYRKI